MLQFLNRFLKKIKICILMHSWAFCLDILGSTKQDLSFNVHLESLVLMLSICLIFSTNAPNHTHKKQNNEYSCCVTNMWLCGSANNPHMRIRCTFGKCSPSTRPMHSDLTILKKVTEIHMKIEWLPLCNALPKCSRTLVW